MSSEVRPENDLEIAESLHFNIYTMACEWPTVQTFGYWKKCVLNDFLKIFFVLSFLVWEGSLVPLPQRTPPGVHYV